MQRTYDGKDKILVRYFAFAFTQLEGLLLPRVGVRQVGSSENRPLINDHCRYISMQ